MFCCYRSRACTYCGMWCMRQLSRVNDLLFASERDAEQLCKSQATVGRDALDCTDWRWTWCVTTLANLVCVFSAYWDHKVTAHESRSLNYLLNVFCQRCFSCYARSSRYCMVVKHVLAEHASSIPTEGVQLLLGCSSSKVSDWPHQKSFLNWYAAVWCT